MGRYRRDFGNRSYYGHLITKDQLNEGTAMDGEPGLQQALHNEIVDLNNNRYGLLSGFETSISGDVVTIGEGTVILNGNLNYSSGGTVSGVSDGDYIYLGAGGFHVASSIDDINGLIIAYVSSGSTYDNYRAGITDDLPDSGVLGRVGFAHEYIYDLIVEEFRTNRIGEIYLVYTEDDMNVAVSDSSITTIYIMSDISGSYSFQDRSDLKIYGNGNWIENLNLRSISSDTYYKIQSCEINQLTVYVYHTTNPSFEIDLVDNEISGILFSGQLNTAGGIYSVRIVNNNIGELTDVVDYLTPDPAYPGTARNITYILDGCNTGPLRYEKTMKPYLCNIRITNNHISGSSSGYLRYDLPSIEIPDSGIWMNKHQMVLIANNMIIGYNPSGYYETSTFSGAFNISVTSNILVGMSASANYMIVSASKNALSNGNIENTYLVIVDGDYKVDTDNIQH